MRTALVVVISLLLLLPIWMMVAGSFMEMNEMVRRPPLLWPADPTLVSYQTLLRGEPVLMWLVNTAVLAAATVTLSTGLCGITGYAFATQAGVGWLYFLYMACLTIPRSILIIPMFLQMRWLGVQQTLGAVLIPAIFYPAGIFMMYSQVRSIPQAFIDCARIDGASELQTLAHVIAPMSTAMIAAVGLMKFIEAMTDYLWQSLNLMESDTQTLLVGVMFKALSQRGAGGLVNRNAVSTALAGGTVLLVPLLAAFLVMFRHFKKGVTDGGLKD